ncbi:ubiquitin carboxyl-terminal hydrolase UCHL3 [Toxoplasma gondii GAB2-2007-GAL-DOM2]|uniref:ubiquitinyl hydrolase 1 n=12 Tax=Toxoplasma gondii TaxID=5811 RepID=B9Q0S6_TOXGV|nr:ubiquitin carboxyl-terminal hydrolase UCHL3 [Toxoplasma gondii GT1]ESS31780.1 ubiquitin carboxyl-terminal hydrolase UCHL3 [Toxoplasma gondii VEG]KAF4640945.1 ubiquitin carboxyl-terminal hydrolase UCHL3 [Toxoplasma gondii]KFG30893.1 ubiquitin carboxyl-terminal hydrolase UCHL3 [Toxoplasma gondii GAB2-2007-GAL-DOM2]KFG34891.1 ubiquitin carboxyl-terminal hydrolase UCHL3 [Toxoplasma gondii p89]PIM05565.1 ubiquitin carboxyl-terminal hydrolase UCHL3 [Toxoplasma gondii COUG]
MEGKSACKWLPLEADPLLFAQYVNELGGPVAAAVEHGGETEKRHEGHEALLSFEDVLALESWAAEMVAHPTVAVLLLFPITEATEKGRREQDKQTAGQSLNNVWFTKQTVGNACGTVALLHCLANLPREKFPLQPNRFLEHFLKETADLSPEQRAKVLETDRSLASAHKSFEQQGQSAVPPRESDVDTHFVAFVFHEGHLVELDGRRATPVDHGAVEGGATLEDAARNQRLLKMTLNVIQKEFVEKCPGELRFQVIAVGDAKAA